MKVCELTAPAIFSWTPGSASWIAETTNPRPSTPAPANPQSPNSPVIRPPRDAVAPVIAGARLSAARLRAGRRHAELPALRAVRRHGHRHAQEGPPYRALSPTMPLGASAGTVSRRFDGRLGSKALKPGRYKLAIAAVDAAGNAARPAGVAFRMVR